MYNNAARLHTLVPPAARTTASAHQDNAKADEGGSANRGRTKSAAANAETAAANRAGSRPTSNSSRRRTMAMTTTVRAGSEAQAPATKSSAFTAEVSRQHRPAHVNDALTTAMAASAKEADLDRAAVSLPFPSTRTDAFRASADASTREPIDPCVCASDSFDAWLTAWVLTIPPPTSRNSGASTSSLPSSPTAESGSAQQAGSPKTSTRRDQNRKLFLQREAALRLAYDRFQDAAEALERHLFTLGHRRDVLTAYYDVVEEDIAAAKEAEIATADVDASLPNATSSELIFATHHAAHEHSSFHRAARQARRQKPLERYEARQTSTQDRLEKVYYVIHQLEQLEGALGGRANGNRGGADDDDDDEDGDEDDQDDGVGEEDARRKGVRADSTADDSDARETRSQRKLRRQQERRRRLQNLVTLDDPLSAGTTMGGGQSTGVDHLTALIDTREVFQPGGGVCGASPFAQDSALTMGTVADGSATHDLGAGVTVSTSAYDERRSTPVERKRRRMEATLAQRVRALKSQLQLPRQADDVVSRVRNELLLAFSTRVLALRTSRHVGTSTGPHSSPLRVSSRETSPRSASKTSNVRDARLPRLQNSSECQIEQFVEWYVKEIVDPFALSQLLHIVPNEYMVTTTTRLVYGSDANGVLRASRALPDLTHVMLRAIAEGRLDAFAQLATSPSVSYLNGTRDLASRMALLYVALFCGQLEVLEAVVSHGFYHPHALLGIITMHANWDEAASWEAARAKRRMSWSIGAHAQGYVHSEGEGEGDIPVDRRGANLSSEYRRHLFSLIAEVFGDDAMERRRREAHYRQRHPDVASAAGSAIDALTSWEGLFNPTDQLAAKDLIRQLGQALVMEADVDKKAAWRSSSRDSRRNEVEDGHTTTDEESDDESDSVCQEDPGLQGGAAGVDAHSGAQPPHHHRAPRRAGLSAAHAALTAPLYGVDSQTTSHGLQSLRLIRMLLRMLHRTWMEVDQLAQCRLDTLLSGLAGGAAAGAGGRGDTEIGYSRDTNTAITVSAALTESTSGQAAPQARVARIASRAAPPSLLGNLKLYYGPHVVSAVALHQPTGTFAPTSSAHVGGVHADMVATRATGEESHVTYSSDRIKAERQRVAQDRRSLLWLLDSGELDAVTVASLACRMTPAFSSPMLHRADAWSYRPLRDTMYKPLWVCADVPMVCVPTPLHAYMTNDAIEALEDIWSSRFVYTSTSSGEARKRSDDTGGTGGVASFASVLSAAQSDKRFFLTQMHIFQRQRQQRECARRQRAELEVGSNHSRTASARGSTASTSAAHPTAPSLPVEVSPSCFYFESHVSLEYLLLAHRHNCILQDEDTALSESRQASSASLATTPRSETSMSGHDGDSLVGSMCAQQAEYAQTVRSTPPNLLVMGWCSAECRRFANGRVVSKAAALGVPMKPTSTTKSTAHAGGEGHGGVSGGISVDIVRVHERAAHSSTGMTSAEVVDAFVEVEFRLLHHQDGCCVPLRRRSQSATSEVAEEDLVLKTVLRASRPPCERAKACGRAPRPTRRQETRTTYFPAVSPVQATLDDDAMPMQTSTACQVSKTVGPSPSDRDVGGPTSSTTSPGPARRSLFSDEGIHSGRWRSQALVHGLPPITTATAAGDASALFGEHALVLGFFIDVLSGHVQLTVNGTLVEAELSGVNRTASQPVVRSSSGRTHTNQEGSERSEEPATTATSTATRVCVLYPAATVQASGSVIDCLDMADRGRTDGDGAALNAIFRFAFDSPLLLALEPSLRARYRSAATRADHQDHAHAVSLALMSRHDAPFTTPPAPVLLDATYKYNHMLRVLTTVRSSHVTSFSSSTTAQATATRPDGEDGDAAISTSEARVQDALLQADVLLQRTLLQAQQLLNQCSSGGLTSVMTVVPLRVPRRSADAVRGGLLALAGASSPFARGGGDGRCGEAGGISSSPRSTTDAQLNGSTYTILSSLDRLSPLCFAIAARRPEMAYGIATHVLTDFHNSSDVAVRQRRLALQAASALGYAHVLQVLLERMPVYEVLEAFGIAVQKDVRQQLRRAHKQRGQAAVRQYLLAVADGREGGEGGAQTCTGVDAIDSADEDEQGSHGADEEKCAGSGNHKSDGMRDARASGSADAWMRLPLPPRHRYAGAQDHTCLVAGSVGAARATTSKVTTLEAGHLYSTHRREYTPLHFALLGGPHPACATALLNYLYVNLSFRRRTTCTTAEDARSASTKDPAVTGAGDATPFVVRPTHAWLREAINVSTPAGESALLMAIRYGLESTAERLLSLGADAACMDRTSTAYGLEIACSNRSNRVATLLLDLDVYQRSLHMINHAGVATPLCWCALSNTPELIVKLLARGASTSVGIEGHSPLQLAVMFGNEAAAQALLMSCQSLTEAALAHPALPKLPGAVSSASTATRQAQDRRTDGSHDRLPFYQPGITTNTYGRDAGDHRGGVIAFPTVSTTIPAGEKLTKSEVCETPVLDVDAADGRTQFTALHIACEMGLLSVVQGLLARRASLMVLTKVSCQTPLHVALVFGHEDVAMALLTYGKDQLRRGKVVLDVAAADKNGDTALHLACKAGCASAVDYLLTQYSASEVEKSLAHHTQKRKQQQQLQSGTTASSFSSTGAASHIRATCVNVLAENNSGKTPLLLAIQSAVTSVVELVVAAITELPHASDEAESLGGPLVDGTCLALHYALNAQLKDVVLLLLSDARFPVSPTFKRIFLNAYRAADVPASEATHDGEPRGNRHGDGSADVGHIDAGESDARPNQVVTLDVDAQLRAQRAKGALHHQIMDRRTAMKLEALARMVSPTTTSTTAMESTEEDSSRKNEGTAATASDAGAALALPTDTTTSTTRRARGRYIASRTSMVDQGKRAGASVGVTARRKDLSTLDQRRRSSYIRGLLARSVASATPPRQAVHMLLRGFSLPELYVMLNEVAEESVTIGIQTPAAMLYGEMMTGFLLEHHRVVIAPNRVVSFAREALAAVNETVSSVYAAGSPINLHPSPQGHPIESAASSSSALPSWLLHKDTIRIALSRAPTFSTQVMRVMRTYGLADNGERVIEELETLVAGQRVDMERVAATGTDTASAEPTTPSPLSSPGENTAIQGGADATGTAAARREDLCKHKNGLFTEAHFTSPMGYTALQLAASLGLGHVVEYLLCEFPTLSPLHVPRVALLTSAELHTDADADAAGAGPTSSPSPSLPSTVAELLVRDMTDTSSAASELSMKLHDVNGFDERKWLLSPFRLAVRSGEPSAVASVVSAMRERYTKQAEAEVAEVGETASGTGGREHTSMITSTSEAERHRDELVDRMLARLVNYKEPVWVDVLQRTVLQELIASRLAPNIASAPDHSLRRLHAAVAEEASARADAVFSSFGGADERVSGGVSGRRGQRTRLEAAATLAAIAALNTTTRLSMATASLLKMVRVLLQHGARVCGLFDLSGRDAWLLAASLDGSVGSRLCTLLMTEEAAGKIRARLFRTESSVETSMSQAHPSHQARRAQPEDGFALPLLATLLARHEPSRPRLMPHDCPARELLRGKHALLRAWRASGYGVARLREVAKHAAGSASRLSDQVCTGRDHSQDVELPFSAPEPRYSALSLTEAGLPYEDDSAAEAEELEYLSNEPAHVSGRADGGGLGVALFGHADACSTAGPSQVPRRATVGAGDRFAPVGEMPMEMAEAERWRKEEQDEVAMTCDAAQADADACAVWLAPPDRARLRFLVQRYLTFLFFSLAEHNPDFLVHTLLAQYPQLLTRALHHPASHDTLLTILLKNAVRRLSASQSSYDAKRQVRAAQQQDQQTQQQERFLYQADATVPTPLQPNLLVHDDDAERTRRPGGAPVKQEKPARNSSGYGAAVDSVDRSPFSAADSDVAAPTAREAASIPEVKRLVDLVVHLLHTFPALQQRVHTSCAVDLTAAAEFRLERSERRSSDVADYVSRRNSRHMYSTGTSAVRASCTGSAEDGGSDAGEGRAGLRKVETALSLAAQIGYVPLITAIVCLPEWGRAKRDDDEDGEDADNDARAASHVPVRRETAEGRPPPLFAVSARSSTREEERSSGSSAEDESDDGRKRSTSRGETRVAATDAVSGLVSTRLPSTAITAARSSQSPSLASTAASSNHETVGEHVESTGNHTGHRTHLAKSATGGQGMRQAGSGEPPQESATIATLCTHPFHTRTVARIPLSTVYADVEQYAAACYDDDCCNRGRRTSGHGGDADMPLKEQLSRSLEDAVVRVRLATGAYYDLDALPAIGSILSALALQTDAKARRLEFVRHVFPNLHPVAALHIAVEYANAAPQFLGSVECMNAFWVAVLYAQFTNQLNPLEVSAKTWNVLLRHLLPTAPAIPIFLLQKRCPELERSRERQRERAQQRRRNLEAVTQGALMAASAVSRVSPPRQSPLDTMTRTISATAAAHVPPLVLSPCGPRSAVTNVSMPCSSATSPRAHPASSNQGSGRDARLTGGRKPDAGKVKLSNWSSLRRRADVFLQLTSMTVAELWIAMKSGTTSTAATASGRPSLMNTLLLDVIELAVRYDDVPVFQSLTRIAMPSAAPPHNLTAILDSMASATEKNGNTNGGPSQKNSEQRGRRSLGPAPGKEDVVTGSSAPRPPRFTLHKKVLQYLDNYATAVWVSCPTLAYAALGSPHQANAVLQRMNDALWYELLQERHVDLIAVAAGSRRVLESLYTSPPKDVQAYLSAWRYDRIDAHTGLPEGMVFPVAGESHKVIAGSLDRMRAQARGQEDLNQTMASLTTLAIPASTTGGNAQSPTHGAAHATRQAANTTAESPANAPTALSRTAIASADVDDTNTVAMTAPVAMPTDQVSDVQQRARAEDELAFARSCMRVGSSMFVSTAARQEIATVTWGIGAEARIVDVSAPRQSKMVRFLTEDVSVDEESSKDAGALEEPALRGGSIQDDRRISGARMSVASANTRKPSRANDADKRASLSSASARKRLSSARGSLTGVQSGASGTSAEDNEASLSAPASPQWFMYLQNDWAMHAALSLHSPHPSQASLDVLVFLMNLRTPLSVSVVDFFLIAAAQDRAALLPPSASASAAHPAHAVMPTITPVAPSMWYATAHNSDTLLHLLVINDQCELAEYYLAATLYLFSQAHLDAPTLQPGRFTIREKCAMESGVKQGKRREPRKGGDTEWSDANDDAEMRGVDSEDEDGDNNGAASASLPVSFLRFVLRVNKHGLTPFDYARSAGMVQLLQQYGCVPPTYRPNPLTFSRALRGPSPSLSTTTVGPFFAVPRLLLATDEFLTLQDNVQNNEAIHAAAGLRSKSRASRRQYERARLALFQMISANTTVTADGKAVDRSGMPFTGSRAAVRGQPLPDAVLLRQLLQTQKQTQKAILPILLDSQISLLHLGLCAADDELVIAHQQQQARSKQRLVDDSATNADDFDGTADAVGSGAAYGADEEDQDGSLLITGPRGGGRTRRIPRYNASLLPPQLYSGPKTAKSTSSEVPATGGRDKLNSTAASITSTRAGSPSITATTTAASKSASAATASVVRTNTHPLTQRDVIEMLEKRQFVLFPLYLPPPPPPPSEEEKKLQQWRLSRDKAKKDEQRQRTGSRAGPSRLSSASTPAATATTASSTAASAGLNSTAPPFFRKAMVAHNADAEATVVESAQPNEAAVLIALTPMQLAQGAGGVSRGIAQALSATASIYPRQQFTSRLIRLPKAGQAPAAHTGPMRDSTATARTTAESGGESRRDSAAAAAAAIAAGSVIASGLAVVTVPVLLPNEFVMPAEDDLVELPVSAPAAATASVSSTVHVGLAAKMAAQLDKFVHTVQQRTQRRAHGKLNGNADTTLKAAPMRRRGRDANGTRTDKDHFNREEATADSRGGNPLLVETISPVGGVATAEQQRLMKALLTYFASSSMTAQLSKTMGFTIAPNYDVVAAGDAVAAVRHLKSSAARFSDNL